jgi:hypothetical protein
LEPETPEGFELFSNRGNKLFFTGRRNDSNDSFTESAELNTTWRLIISVSADEKLINEKRVFFRIIGEHRLELVSDPETVQN